MRIMKDKIRYWFMAVKKWLGSLSFRTGIIIGLLCVVFYILSFAQMFLPLSVSVKGILWVIFFGLAKTAQYSAILILGKEGIRRLRQLWKKRSLG